MQRDQLWLKFRSVEAASLGHRGVNHSRGDCVDSQTLIGVLDRRDFRQADHPMLTGVVCGTYGPPTSPATEDMLTIEPPLVSECVGSRTSYTTTHP